MNVKLFSTDLDGTLIGKPDAALKFKATWEKLEKNSRPLLCYNTSRSVANVQKLIRVSKRIPQPDFLICGLGTEIYDIKKKKYLKEYSASLDKNWDSATIERIICRFPEIRKQPQPEQTKLKSSWYYHDATPSQIEEIIKAIQNEEIAVNFVYARSKYLDIVPQEADKGKALEWLIDYLKITASGVLVSGNGQDDISMFKLEGVIGIVVENAQPELYEVTVEKPVYRSQAPFADGILEGLKHYEVIAKIYDISLKEFLQEEHFGAEISRLLKTDHLTQLTVKQKSFLQEAYEKAIAALKKNITHLGFSACSLEDNTVVGTDANYRSVWGRDGAMVTMASLSLEDEQVRICQKNTLITLLKHMSPTGQIPSHVLIDHDISDYSGVGGICSIDSGLWLIIAFYEFIRVTDDIDFLYRYGKSLQHVMNWLSAHDANNDALLEIPEAGDWTDLFGRSYNILYDEVLWYRTNLCFGRLLELLGNYRKAEDYFKWAQKIKAAIIQKFWPTTANTNLNKTFTDLQFSIGETQYLLAQVTPFGFNWRCDVYANILAFLFNVLDTEHARIAFRFMWAVGVNEPYPVVNLYPCVHGGDPDWKNYYVVNLLNLPHHYHNGGIWPFIGGLWVQFIYRLGLIDIACKELIKLAQLNQQGKSQEWEFNEWVHGKTGRPMGKAYQAWSAASFIWAYHDLKALIEQR